MDHDRIRRLRNYQCPEWYSAFVMQPLAIAWLYFLVDRRWVTPNRLTSFGNILKIAAVGLILTGNRDAAISAAIVLQLGLVFDHMDGTLARYRGSGTSFGSYYDKLSDGVTLSGAVFAMAWIAYQTSGDGTLLLLAGVTCASFFGFSYAKWVAVVEQERLKWLIALDDPVAAVTEHNRKGLANDPPVRSPADWAKWFFKHVLGIVRFQETDLFFWIGLALIVERVDICLWVLAISQGIGLIVALVLRGREVWNVDTQRQRIIEQRRPLP